MGEEIKDMFFIDKLRAAATTLLMALILGAIVVAWAFPRHPSNTVDQATLDTLHDVSTQVKRAADKLEQNGNLTISLNETLTRQLKLQQDNRDETYTQLLKRYGLDTTGLDTPSVGVPAPPTLVTPISGRVLPPNNHLGSTNLPASPSAASGNRQLQESARDHQDKADGSTTSVPTS